MCRLLLVTALQPVSPKKLLTRFGLMAKESRALDGDWQGDGWGIAWVDEQHQWQLKKSLQPIWQEQASFDQLPKTKMFIVHARSASFSQHKDVLEFNQPYISGKYAFIFNGLLKGVMLSGIPGKIGAQKIWHLLQQELKEHQPQRALENVKTLLIKNSRQINALNIGLADTENVYTLNYFTTSPGYYTLRQWNEGDIKIVCSEPL